MCSKLSQARQLLARQKKKEMARFSGLFNAEEENEQEDEPRPVRDDLAGLLGQMTLRKRRRG